MQDSTLKETTRQLDALLPASLAGAISYHGIKDFPTIIYGYVDTFLSSTDSYLFTGHSLKVAFDNAISAISKTPLAEFTASYQDTLALVWALGCFAYLYRSILKIQDQQAGLKPPPLPRVEPDLP